MDLYRLADTLGDSQCQFHMALSLRDGLGMYMAIWWQRGLIDTCKYNINKIGVKQTRRGCVDLLRRAAVQGSHKLKTCYRLRMRS
jgi:hypothetical protein